MILDHNNLYDDIFNFIFFIRYKFLNINVKTQLVGRISVK